MFFTSLHEWTKLAIRRSHDDDYDVLQRCFFLAPANFALSRK